MDMNHLINIHPERNEILLIPHGLTKSEKNFFNHQGYYAISLKNGEQDEKLDCIFPCMDYSDFKKSRSE
jgi:hypothetical protein